MEPGKQNSIRKGLVSVVIPVHERPDALRRALKSVLSQSYQHFEVRVVDDASKANILDVCEAFQDPRINYHRLEEKRNGSTARNIGIKEAKGEFVALLDSDDEWRYDHLERKLSLMDECGVDGIFGSAIAKTPSGEKEFISRSKGAEESMLSYYLNGGVGQTSSFFLKRVELARIRFDEGLLRNQDFDLAIRFAKEYKLLADQTPTSIIHWEGEGGKTKKDPDSYLRFFLRYKEEVSDEDLAKLAIMQSGKIKDHPAYPEYFRSFHREVKKRIRGIHLMDYMSFVRPRNIIEKAIYRLRYYFYLLFT